MESKPGSKYERVRKIGVGSYGVVFKCINKIDGKVVAIKRYSENDSDPTIRKIAMREVRMLRQLKHPNLITLLEVFRRKSRLHLVFDYCELTVLDVIEKYGPNCPLNLIKKIIWQTVNAINFCHQHNCIHRDIKPENILINQSGIVKLCDFGFARNIPLGILKRESASSGETEAQIEEQENLRERQAMTEYVATRWYRAPELLIGEIYYDTSIDIWAIGCVTAELMRGEPIWPGKTDCDQLSIIMKSLGPLTLNQTHTLYSQAIYSQSNIERLMSQNNFVDAIEKKIPARAGQSGLDFVSMCLNMDPARRPKSGQLLVHPYIHSVRMVQFIRGEEANSLGPTSASSLQNHRLVSLAPLATGAEHNFRSTPTNSDQSLAGKSKRNGQSNSKMVTMAAAAAAQNSVQSKQPAKRPVCDFESSPVDGNKRQVAHGGGESPSKRPVAESQPGNSLDGGGLGKPAPVGKRRTLAAGQMPNETLICLANPPSRSVGSLAASTGSQSLVPALVNARPNEMLPFESKLISQRQPAKSTRSRRKSKSDGSTDGQPAATGNKLQPGAGSSSTQSPKKAPSCHNSDVNGKQQSTGKHRTSNNSHSRSHSEVGQVDHKSEAEQTTSGKFVSFAPTTPPPPTGVPRKAHYVTPPDSSTSSSSFFSDSNSTTMGVASSYSRTIVASSSGSNRLPSISASTDDLLMEGGSEIKSTGSFR